MFFCYINNGYNRCIVSKTMNIIDIIDVLSLNNEYNRGIVSKTMNIIDVSSTKQ